MPHALSSECDCAGHVSDRDPAGRLLLGRVDANPATQLCAGAVEEAAVFEQVGAQRLGANGRAVAVHGEALSAARRYRLRSWRRTSGRSRGRGGAGGCRGADRVGGCGAAPDADLGLVATGIGGVAALV